MSNNSVIKCIRSIRRSNVESKIKDVYLTFDDGPLSPTTEQTLLVLGTLKVHATFFCIARRAQENAQLFRQIVANGHAIGNHSLDHNYRNFFKNESSLIKWITEAEQTMVQLSGQQTVGFRSPAGVITPPLRRALGKLNMPLVHWNMRFYDTVLSFTKDKATRAAQQIDSGSIILLHDSQSHKCCKQFLMSLETFITLVRKRGLSFAPLSRELLVQNGCV